MSTQDVVNGNNWKTIFKKTDETRTSNTTLSNDADLQFAIEANATYEFELFVTHYSDSGAYKYALSAPGSLTGRTIMRQTKTQTGTKVDAVDSTPVGSTAVTSTSEFGYVFMKGQIKTGASSGTVAYQFAQNSSNGSPAFDLAGSYIKYRRVDA